MRLSALLCGIMLLVTCPSFAQSNVTIYVEGGTQITNQPKQFDDFYSTGVHAGGGVGYAINRDLEVLLRAHYNALPFDGSGAKSFLTEGGFITPGDQSETQVKGADANFLSGSISLKLTPSFGGRLKVYLIGGVGLYHYETYDVSADFPPGFEEQSFEFTEQEGTDIGLNIGFGLSLPMTEKIDVRVEPKLIFAFSGKAEEMAPPFERTGNLSYFPVQFGVAWNL